MIEDHSEQENKQTGNQDYIDNFPNYHPLIVHFLLMLLVLAAAMQIAMMFFEIKLYNYTVVLISIGGFAGALRTKFVFHAHPADNINSKAKSVFSNHKKLVSLSSVEINSLSLPIDAVLRDAKGASVKQSS